MRNTRWLSPLPAQRSIRRASSSLEHSSPSTHRAMMAAEAGSLARTGLRLPGQGGLRSGRGRDCPAAAPPAAPKSPAGSGGRGAFGTPPRRPYRIFPSACPRTGCLPSAYQAPFHGVALAQCIPGRHRQRRSTRPAADRARSTAWRAMAGVLFSRLRWARTISPVPLRAMRSGKAAGVLVGQMAFAAQDALLEVVGIGAAAAGSPRRGWPPAPADLRRAAPPPPSSVT